MAKKYTKLEYIESTGTQLIDTEYIPNNNSHFICEFSGGNPNSTVFGSDSGSYTNNSLFIGNNEIGKGIYLIINEALWRDTSTVHSDKKIIEIKCKNYFKVNDNIYDISAYNITNEKTLSLFGLHRGDDYFAAPFKVYSFQILENGVLKSNYIPAKTSTGVVCMYDTVSDEFFYNQGTGYFIAGPVVSPHVLENDNIKII